MGDIMKIDNRGLVYFNEESKGKEIIFDKIPRKNGLSKPSAFYELIEDPRLLIKYSFEHLNDAKVYQMLRKFIELQSKIYNIDFPTCYYVEDNKLSGLIVPHYREAPSLFIISETHSLDELMKYYKHDDDLIHNLFLLLNDILNMMEILVENGICYQDSNSGNFVLFDNEVKLIDFDYRFLSYDCNKENVLNVLDGIDKLVFLLNLRFGLIDLCYYRIRSFDKMRKHLIKVENRVRKIHNV